MRAFTWQTQGNTQPLLCELVTGDYFPTLGVRIATGRTFGPEADDRGGGQAVAVMNYGTWQITLWRRSRIVGRQLRLNDVVVTVIGVTRPGFIGVNGLVGPDLWMPFALGEQLLPNEMRTASANRSMPLLQGIGRLKPGVTVAGRKPMSPRSRRRWRVSIRPRTKATRRGTADRRRAVRRRLAMIRMAGVRARRSSRGSCC